MGLAPSKFFFWKMGLHQELPIYKASCDLPVEFFQTKMMKAAYATLMIMFFIGSMFAQNSSVGINNTGSTPAASAMLDVSSTTKGFLPPRMTTAQRNAISSLVAGLVIYNTDDKALNVFNGTSWGLTNPFFCGNSFGDSCDNKICTTSSGFTSVPAGARYTDGKFYNVGA
jgi:hypothetical protein